MIDWTEIKKKILYKSYYYRKARSIVRKSIIKRIFKSK